MLDSKGLTDNELKASLLKHGVRAGPIVASTRAVYERKLEGLLQPASQPKLNGTGDTGQYSDSEEEEEISVSEQAGPETASHLDQNQQEDRQEPVTDVLMEIFPDTEPTPTGIVATRRRPIKGAAGRPVQFKYPDTPLSPTTMERQELERFLVPRWVQVVVFLSIVCLLYLIYACGEDSLDNPFGAFLENLSLKTGDVEVSLETGVEERLLLKAEPADTQVLDPLTGQE